MSSVHWEDWGHQLSLEVTYQQTQLTVSSVQFSFSVGPRAARLTQ